jgi:hypothetical protein
MYLVVVMLFLHERCPEKRREKNTTHHDNSKIQSENGRNEFKIDHPNTYTHDHSIFWIGNGASFKLAGLI